MLVPHLVLSRDAALGAPFLSAESPPKASAPEAA